MPAVSNMLAVPPAEPPKVAGAPVAGNGAADFLQLMAQLIGATPEPDTALLEDATADSKTDATAEKRDDADEDEALSGDVMAILGLCAAPPPANSTLCAAETESAAINIAQGTKDVLVATTLASTAGEQDSSADDTAPDAETFAAVARESAKASGGASGLTAASTVLTDSLANLGKALATDGNASSSADPNSSVQASSLLAAGATRTPSNIDVTQQPRELRSPVGTHAWRDELGDHLTMLAQRGHDSASLRLSPEHLGPLEVRISMREGEASVWFGAANADTRAALDQSLPRLREMFASQGMVLADAGVFKDAPRGQPRPMALNGSPRRDDMGSVGPVTQVAVKHLRLIDTYA
jgi:flagellar hook-length control protein FliK